MASYGSPTEKANVIEAETANASDRSAKVEIDDVNGIRAVSCATLESFSHLDEKKILRKVCFLYPHTVDITNNVM
jgi:hypothetical protein